MGDCLAMCLLKISFVRVDAAAMGAEVRRLCYHEETHASGLTLQWVSPMYVFTLLFRV